MLNKIIQAIVAVMNLYSWTAICPLWMDIRLLRK
jgi:hypothetical protein